MGFVFIAYTGNPRISLPVRKFYVTQDLHHPLPSFFHFKVHDF